MRTIAALLVFCSVSWATPETSAVKVCMLRYTEDENGMTHQHGGLASGVVIANGKDKSGDDYSIILTNAHVAPVDATYHIIYSKKLIPCEWLGAVPRDKWTTEGDLALLMCWAKIPVAELADKEPEKNSEIYQWSFPKGGRLTKLNGKFQGNTGGWCNTGDYTVFPGCSGSAVYSGDKVIGLCDMCSNKTDAAGNTVKDKDGNPACFPPCHMITLKHMRDFLVCHIPKEMGYEIGPLPRVVSGR